MKCIVCVKQVPDTSGVVAVKEDGTMDAIFAKWMGEDFDDEYNAQVEALLAEEAEAEANDGQAEGTK